MLTYKSTSMDHWTLEDFIKYAAIGFEFEICDGHVVRATLRRRDHDVLRQGN